MGSLGGSPGGSLDFPDSPAGIQEGMSHGIPQGIPQETPQGTQDPPAVPQGIPSASSESTQSDLGSIPWIRPTTMVSSLFLTMLGLVQSRFVCTQLLLFSPRYSLWSRMLTKGQGDVPQPLLFESLFTSTCLRFMSCIVGSPEWFVVQGIVGSPGC